MTPVAASRVRVWVTDVWDAVDLAPAATSTIADLKVQALAAATGRRPDPAEYVVKFRGTIVADEGRTLADLGAGDGAPFIVLPARRQPVR